MSRQRHPRFSEEELRVMVEEIQRVEPQLFGSQVQHTSIARKMELWHRIVDRVNAVGQHPRNREDIRKRITKDRHHTGGSRQLHSTPPTEEAHSDDSSFALLDPDDQPGTSWALGQSVPLAQAQPNTDLPPSGNTSTAPTQRPHTSLPRTRQSAVCPPLQETQDNPPPQQQQGPGGSGSGHTVQGTEAQEHRGTGRAAVRQGVDRPREPTLHEALSSIMGAYHHSQETMATVLAKFQETQRLQDEQYLGFREELRTISSALGTIVRVLKDIQQTLRDTVALQGVPDTSMDDELPTTSADASGQDAPPQDHHTSTPPPADGQPLCKQSLRSRNRTEQDGKTPARK
ncbi:hypothetical protein NDU88_000107 [Pleurodeles waltl]|uniref:Myb/SANT-like DNA-binding domain-containing protein n=1 Tax=Pleurodeles waltl TaxID=8319 RepID=A0AAV7UP20_PLEWA|nr:hypothetical protein NDU88_000107 [Pleurodeles waltl]